MVRNSILPRLQVVKHPHHMAEKTTTLKLQLPLSQRQQGQLVQKPQQKVHQPTKLVPTPNKAALTNFVARNHLGKISYQTKEMKSKKAICFFSVVKIDKKTFMSYPNEKPTKLESEEEAARCALEDLKAQFEGNLKFTKTYIKIEM